MRLSTVLIGVLLALMFAAALVYALTLWTWALYLASVTALVASSAAVGWHVIRWSRGDDSAR